MRKLSFHQTAVAQHNAAFTEELTDFREGERIMTSDGFPGRVTAVLYGPFQRTEHYQVELDHGLGGGDYLPGQLRSYKSPTASRVEAAEVVASVPVEASTDHLAHVDYPELEDILLERQPLENLKVYAAVNKDDQASLPDMATDDPGENLSAERDVEEPDPDDSEDPDADPEQGDGEEADAKVGDVTPPSACSYCGSSSFGEPKTTGRGVRMRCDQCGGTMVSWGGQWQPEFPNSSQNAPSQQGDYRSGGVGGIGNAPGALPSQRTPDDDIHERPEAVDGEDDDGKTIKLKIESVVQQMTYPEVAESLQAQSGIVQWLFNRVYEKARDKYERDHAIWWEPPTSAVGTNLEGPAQYNLIEPKKVSLGSVSDLDDPIWRWHWTATWMDVQAKATRLRRENHVKIVVASKTYVVAEVLGDNATYETQLNYVPGTRKVADWACGCKWGAYTWGRSPRFRRFEGRLCSHALATQYEANARGIFGSDVEPDKIRPNWQKAHSPVVVQHDRSKGKDLTRRAVPPGNMKRTFSSLLLDSDQVYPEPLALDLAHPPVYASIQTMLDNGSKITEVTDVLASFGFDTITARSLLFEALLSTAYPEGYLGHPDGSESLSVGFTEASKTASEACDCAGARKIEPHTWSEHPEWAQKMHAAGKSDAWGHPIMQPYDGHGAWGCNNYQCAEHPQELYDHHPGQAPGWMVHEHDPHRELTREVNKSFHDSGTQENGRYLLDQQHTGPTKYSSTEKTADYSTADPFAGFNTQNYPTSVPHSNSENPASTGWATSQDPGDWGKSLITNNFGVTFDASLHHLAIEDFDFPESHHVVEYDETSGRRMMDAPENYSFPTREHAERYVNWLGRKYQEDRERPMPEGRFKIHSPRPVVIEHKPRSNFELPGRTIDASLHDEERTFFHPHEMGCKHCGWPVDIDEHTGRCPRCDNLALEDDHLHREPMGGSTHVWWGADNGLGKHHEEFDLRGYHPDTQSPMHTLSGRHAPQDPNQIQFSYETGLAHGHAWIKGGGDPDIVAQEAKARAAYHEVHNPGMKYHYMDGFVDGANILGNVVHASLDEPAQPSMSEAAADHLARMMDATLHETPEAALPFTEGNEEIDPSPDAGNTRDGEHGDYTFNTTGSLTPEQQIVLAFQATAGARALRKEAAKDFSFEEQQELINEGGGKPRNFSDLKIAGTHYELLGDGDEDETVLWV